MFYKNRCSKNFIKFTGNHKFNLFPASVTFTSLDVFRRHRNETLALLASNGLIVSWSVNFTENKSEYVCSQTQWKSKGKHEAKNLSMKICNTFEKCYHECLIMRAFERLAYIFYGIAKMCGNKVDLFWDHSLSTYATFSEKLIFLIPALIRTCTCTVGVRNISFSKNFA